MWVTNASVAGLVCYVVASRGPRSRLFAGSPLKTDRVRTRRQLSVVTRGLMGCAASL